MLTVDATAQSTVFHTPFTTTFSGSFRTRSWARAPSTAHVIDAGRSTLVRETFGKRHNTTVECRIGDVPNDLDRSVVVTLYRVSQEALRNIAKHAEAKNVTFELSTSHREIRLSINDDGSGFDVAVARNARGLGLAGMNERLKLVAGTLEIASKVGKGTRIEATVPLGGPL